ncbi:MAG: hypothetical protein AAF216_07845 [Pseudomonadota bacterium]
MSVSILKASLALAGLGFCCQNLSAAAQTVGSVFGPGVNADDRQWEYRIGIAPDEGDNGDAAINQRLHYQHALNDSVRLRGIVQGANSNDGDWEFRFVQGELVWQVIEKTPRGHQGGFRFDFRLNEGDDGANQFGLNWTSQLDLDNGWRLRGLILLDADVGDRARDGVFIETRMAASRKLENGLRISLDSFNIYGNSDAGFGNFNDQQHQLGPSVSGPIGTDGWGWFAGALFGVSDGADETNFQFRLTKNL